jgi:hypothetical protein
MVMNKGKSVLATAILSSVISLSYANEFIAIIGIEDAIAQKLGIIEKNITEWENVGLEYNCTSWSPNPNSIDYGESFTQSQDCSQNQSRTKDIYTLYNTGEEVYEKTLTENQTIIITNSQTAIGTKNYIDTTRNGDWSNWSDTGGHYDCGSWSPDPSTINYGESFTQTRSCSQNQERERYVYDVWADGNETLNTTEIESQTITEEESRGSVGTKNYVTSTSTSTGSWSNSGGVYSCSSWSPAASTIDSGTIFTQTRTCKQNQTQTVTTYNNWADGSQTINSTSSNSRTVNVDQTQTATGTKPVTGTWVKTGQDYGSTKYGCTGSWLSGTCSPIGVTQQIWVSAGQSSGVPICQKATFTCK